MEVCNQSVHDLELIARINENVRVPFASLDLAKKGGDALHRPAGGGTHADDPSPGCLGLVDQVCRFLGHGVMLTVHFMLQYIIFLYGTEGTQSHM